MLEIPIYYPKNTRQVRKLIKEYTSIEILAGHILRANTQEEQVLINLERIRDFHNVLKTMHSCMIGLGITIGQLLEYLQSEISYPFLKRCIEQEFSIDMLHITLLQVCFSKNTGLLFLLFLALSNAQVQMTNENDLNWRLFRDVLFEKTEEDYIIILNTEKPANKFPKNIPIKIRINLYEKTKFYVRYSPKYTTTLLPFENLPIVLGQIIFNFNLPQLIDEVQILYYYEGRVILLESYFSRFKGLSFPVPLDQIELVWKHIPKHIFPREHFEFMLQSLISIFASDLL